MESLVKGAIYFADEIKEQYQKLMKLEQGNVPLKEEYEKLQKLLKKEKDFYQFFSYQDLEKGIFYMNKNYQDIDLNPINVISNDFSFSSPYRVYSRIDYLQKFHNIYNEMHTGEMNSDWSYTYLFTERFIDTVFTFLKKAQGIKNNPYFISTKYNLIFSSMSAEKRFLNSKIGFPIDFYFKFLNVDKIDFYQKMDEELDNYILDFFTKINLEEKEDYYESEEFYNKFLDYELEIRVLIFLLKNSDNKTIWKENIDGMEIFTDYELIKRLLNEISLGIYYDEEMKLELLNIL